MVFGLILGNSNVGMSGVDPFSMLGHMRHYSLVRRQ